MTGGIFKKDETALRQAPQKPRLKWTLYVWPVLVCLAQFDDILSGRSTDEGKIIGAYIILALAASILMFRTGRWMKQRRNHASGMRDEAEKKEQP